MHAGGVAQAAPRRKLRLNKAARIRRNGRMTMRYLGMRYLGLALAVLVTVAIPGAGGAAEPTRFVPLKPDELTPPQKEWADAIAVPPR
ncbi:hypothetical protein K7462_29970, partial [Pseudomonas fluorescens]|nr:hypothetical protein [Pseudomonas fluorescens]